MAKQALADIERPLTTVDVAIFTVADESLRALLVKRPHTPGEPFPGLWALPGGFVDVERDADLESCALRKLKEKTGVASPYLEQLGSWGGAKRDPRGWSATHAWFALVSREPLAVKPGGNAPDARWFQIDSVPARLAFDHAEILAAALAALRGRRLEKSAFRTRVLAADLVRPVAKTRHGPYRPAQMYRLKNPREPVFFARTFNPR
jgi:ADP-ribose pyrophosphatase YjhB (NUDIX family)